MVRERYKNNECIWLVLILILAVGLRVVALYLIGTSRLPWDIEFEEIANNLVQSGRYSFSFYHLTPALPTSFIPPVYPLFLAFTRYFWAANGDLVVRLIQIGISCITILGFNYLTRSLGGTQLQATLVALFWAIYPASISYSVDLSTVTVETFFIIIGIWMVVRTASTRSPISAIVAGISLALATLTRPTWFILIPLILVWLAWYFHEISVRSLVVVALLGVASLISLTPWAIYNNKTHSVWMVLSTNGGLNFWIGNNPKATGEYIFPTELNQDLVLSTIHLSEVDRDRFFYTQGIKFIQEHPRQFIHLAGRKLLYFFFFRPNIGNSYEAAKYRLFDLVRWLFIASWLVFIPYAIVGIFSLGKQWREHSLLFVILLSQAVVSMIYFSGTRFRTPIDGLVIIWAVFGITAMVDWLKQRYLNT